MVGVVGVVGVVAQLAKALPDKQEVREFDSRWGHCDFSGRTMALESTTRVSPGGKGGPVRGADKLITFTRQLFRNSKHQPARAIRDCPGIAVPLH